MDNQQPEFSKFINFRSSSSPEVLLLFENKFLPIMATSTVRKWTRQAVDPAIQAGWDLNYTPQPAGELEKMPVRYQCHCLCRRAPVPE